MLGVKPTTPGLGPDREHNPDLPGHRSTLTPRATREALPPKPTLPLAPPFDSRSPRTPGASSPCHLAHGGDAQASAFFSAPLSLPASCSSAIALNARDRPRVSQTDLPARSFRSLLSACMYQLLFPWLRYLHGGKEGGGEGERERERETLVQERNLKHVL